MSEGNVHAEIWDVHPGRRISELVWRFQNEYELSPSETEEALVHWKIWEKPNVDRRVQVFFRMLIQAGVFLGVPAGAIIGAIAALNGHDDAAARGVIGGAIVGGAFGLFFALFVGWLHARHTASVIYNERAESDFVARLNWAAFDWSYVLANRDADYLVFTSNLEISVGAGPATFSDYNTIIVQLYRGRAYIAGPRVKVAGIASRLEESGNVFGHATGARRDGD
jgi:hypothetical protein